jgi:hypothetical protein
VAGTAGVHMQGGARRTGVRSMVRQTGDGRARAAAIRRSGRRGWKDGLGQQHARSVRTRSSAWDVWELVIYLALRIF